MSRKTRTKSKTRNNAKSRAKKATVSTVKSTDTEETVIPTAEPAIIKRGSCTTRTKRRNQNRNASRRKSGY